MARRKMVDWNLPDDGTIGNAFTWEHAAIAVLMDIRDLLAPLRHLECHEFLGIPRRLHLIASHLRERNYLTRTARADQLRRRHRRALRRRAARRMAS